MRYLPLALALVLCPAPGLAAGIPAAPAAAQAAGALPAAPADAAAPAEATVTAGETSGEAIDAVPPPTWVYLVARAKLADADLTQASFLRHPAMDSLAACEAERSAVLMSNSRHFSHYDFKSAGGTGYRMDFRCVEGSQYLAPWRKGERLDRYYRVRTSDGKLELEVHDTFFACRRALRQSTREESIDHFCTQASQAITAPPVLPPDSDPDAGDETAPAPPVAPPAPLSAGNRDRDAPPGRADWGGITYPSPDGRFRLRAFGSLGDGAAVAGTGNAHSAARYCARSTQRLHTN